MVKDYIAKLGTFTYAAEGRIKDASVRAHRREACDEVEAIPLSSRGYRLHENYPNPFNPSTRIAYELPVNGWVQLKVYNTLGQEVATLVNGEKSAGRYEVVWDARNLPSGIYFYRLQANGFSEVKKLLLLK